MSEHSLAAADAGGLKRRLPHIGRAGQAAIALGAIGVVAVGWRGLNGPGAGQAVHAGSETASAARAVQVDTAVVQDVSAPDWTVVTGTVRAELESALATKVSGRITAVRVREGDSVRRGQPLVDLDARDLDAAIAQARASLSASTVGYDSARVSAGMEASLSDARIRSAQAQVDQADAGYRSAQAKLDLVKTGPRRQERTQASLAVSQARAGLSLAESNLRRMDTLVREGAISLQQYDSYKTQRDVAQAQYDTAVQSQSMADEGSRTEDLRAAQEGVQQAAAALSQARAGLRQAQASALQTNVRRQDIQAARAQIGLSRAALRIASVTRDYATLVAPFDGVVSGRLADPGAMASPGVPILKVQGGRIRLEAVIPETALHDVAVGRTVAVTLDASPNGTLNGRVSEVAPQGDPASHTFIAKIDLPATAGVRSGMFGRARLLTGNTRRIMVPAGAVASREGLRYVYVVGPDRIARLRMVTVGDEDGGRVPVLSGLTPGERIAVSHLDTLTDGVTVKD